VYLENRGNCLNGTWSETLYIMSGIQIVWRRRQQEVLWGDGIMEGDAIAVVKMGAEKWRDLRI